MEHQPAGCTLPGVRHECGNCANGESPRAQLIRLLKSIAVLIYLSIGVDEQIISYCF